ALSGDHRHLAFGSCKKPNDPASCIDYTAIPCGSSDDAGVDLAPHYDIGVGEPGKSDSGGCGIGGGRSSGALLGLLLLGLWAFGHRRRRRS
ncbi:MAG: hypothetical protein KAI47_07040, partial [Deltaproteobacteria bacterium]|nr:hypothetical protein [Deltaproteobacteria bacterium]